MIKAVEPDLQLLLKQERELERAKIVRWLRLWGCNKEAVKEAQSINYGMTNTMIRMAKSLAELIELEEYNA